MFEFGRWKIDPVSPLAVIQDDEDGNGICELGDVPAEFQAEKFSHACLIEAAPDLLRALEAMDFEGLSSEARAAVDRARGRDR